MIHLTSRLRTSCFIHITILSISTPNYTERKKERSTLIYLSLCDLPAYRTWDNESGRLTGVDSEQI
jgi:hypothetical protein